MLLASVCRRERALRRQPHGSEELAELPNEAVAGGIGCANPVALAGLEPGEDVLELGSGGCIDVLLSARRGGRVYGVDMTAEMLELARTNQGRSGAPTPSFARAASRRSPCPTPASMSSSRTAINLSVYKPAMFAEAARVLRPGGRLAIADVVADREPDLVLRADPDAWTGCIAGAVTRPRYRSLLTDAGFVDIDIVDNHAVADGHWSVFVRTRTRDAA